MPHCHNIHSDCHDLHCFVKKKFVATISTIFPQLSLLFFLAAIHISGVHPDNVIWTVPVEKIFARSKHSEIGQAPLHWVISLLKKLIQFHLSWSGDNYKLALIPAAPLCCRRKMCPNKSQLCRSSIFRTIIPHNHWFFNWLFGPTGPLNLWHSNQYVPSHVRMIKHTSILSHWHFILQYFYKSCSRADPYFCD